MFLEVKSKPFRLKWGIDMRFRLIEQQNNTPQTNFFSISWWKFFRDHPPPYIKKICSHWIWTNHKNDLKYFKNRGSLTCL